MKLTRRALVKTGVAAAAAGAVPMQAIAAGGRPVLVVYDSRLPESAAFARTSGAARIDIAAEDANFWRGLRAPVPAGRVVGLTRWADLVVARGWLEEQGKRLKLEEQLVPGGLFRWELI